MSAYHRYMSWVLSHPLLTVAAAVLLTMLMALGLRQVVFEDDYEVFFDGDNAHLQAHHAVERTFSRQDWFTFVVAPKEGTIYARRTLEAIAWLTDESWAIPYVNGIDSITNHQVTTADGDELQVQDLFDSPAELAEHEIAWGREYVRNEPLLPGGTVSRAEDVTLINARIIFPGTRPDENTEVVRAGEEVAERFHERYPDIDLRLAGSTVVNQGFLDGTRSDFGTLVPLMYLVVLLFAGIILRSAWATLGILAMILCAVLSAQGFAAWVGLPLTIVSVSSPTIIMTIAVAAAIHLLLGFLRELRDGREKQEAISNSFLLNLLPVGLTSLTTAIGLLALLITDVPPYRHLGLTCAVGAAFSFVYAYSLLPALMQLLPVRAKAREVRRGVFWDRLADFVIKWRSYLLIGLGGLAVVMVSFAPRNEINDTFITYFDSSMGVRKASEFWMENLDGFYGVGFPFWAPDQGGVHDPEFLQYIEQFSQWADAQENTATTSSLNYTYKRLNQVMHGEDPAWYRLPDDRELAAQYLLLYQMSLPRGKDLTDQIDISRSATIAHVSLVEATNRDVREFSEKADAWIKENLPDHMQTVGTGGTVMFAYIFESSAISNLMGGAIAAGLIAIVLMVVLGSFRIGLISLVPNVLPAAVVFGFWGLVSGRIDIASSSVVIVSLGIVVDDTIHFLTRYRRARDEQGATPEQAVRYAFQTVGAALATTTVVLVGGFVVLTQSVITLNSTLGLLSALIIGTALVLDLLLLPSLLLTLDKFRARISQRRSEATEAEATGP